MNSVTIPKYIMDKCNYRDIILIIMSFTDRGYKYLKINNLMFDIFDKNIHINIFGKTTENDTTHIRITEPNGIERNFWVDEIILCKTNRTKIKLKDLLC